MTDPERQLLLVGDAAGTPDPITAGGLALTLASTRLAADAIVSGDLRAYEGRRLAMGRRAHRLGRWMLWLAQTERRAAWILANLAPVVPMFLDAAVGSRLKGLDRVEGRS